MVHFMLITLLPSYVAPMYSNVTNIHVLVCDLYVAVCVFMDPYVISMYSYVTRMYSRLSLRHVCVRKEEIDNQTSEMTLFVI